MAGEGNLNEARQTAERARTLASESQSFRDRLMVKAIVANLRATSDNFKQVLDELEDVLKQAKATGFVFLRFKTDLALGQIEMRHGDAAKGRARLAALAQEASQKGYALIARKARALL